MQNSDPLVLGRICGGCEECCYVAQVVDESKNFHKPACQKCPFQNNGCSIFGKPQRPQVCSDFQCAWLRGLGTETDRPDKSKVMASINEMNGGKWIFVMDLAKNAHRKTGKTMVAAMLKRFNLPLIVVDYDNLEKGTGDYVILKNSLLPRSRKIAGKKLADFSPEAGIYQLLKET